MCFTNVIPIFSSLPVNHLLKYKYDNLLTLTFNTNTNANSLQAVPNSGNCTTITLSEFILMQHVVILQILITFLSLSLSLSVFKGLKLKAINPKITAV